MRAILQGIPAETRDLAVLTLREMGYKVYTCATADDAWDVFTREQPSLVVFAAKDEVVALCHRIRTTPGGETVTILAVVEHEAPERLHQIIAAGVDDYALAPITPERLRARLYLADRVAGEKRHRRQADRERTDATAELGASQARADRLAMVAARTINGVIITDAERRIEWVNDGFTRITGFSLDDVRGQKPGVFLQGPDTDPETVAYMRGQLTKGEGFTTEVLNYRKTGEKYWVRVEVQPFFKAGGSLSGYMAIETNITEKKQAEEALRESEARARAIVDTSVDAIITIDSEGRIESFNPAAERIFQYAAAEMSGRNVNVLMPEPYHAEHDGYIQSYLTTGHRRIIGIGREVVGRRKDGSTFPMELAVSEVQLNGRRIFTGIVRDISERRRLEQEILEITQQERRRIGQDLHDGLGQMLTGTTLIAQSVARRLDSEGHPAAKDVSEIADLVKEADQHARTLARGLVPVDLEENGLSSALRVLAVNAQRLFGIECTFEEIGSVRLDDNSVATHLYRIAQEAVSNGARHGRASQIRITLAAAAGQIRVRVWDNGVGIGRTEQDPPSENRGMGTQIMHYRSRLIGATLEIRADPEGGTTVLCTLARQAARPSRSALADGVARVPN